MLRLTPQLTAFLLAVRSICLAATSDTLAAPAYGPMAWSQQARRAFAAATCPSFDTTPINRLLNRDQTCYTHSNRKSAISPRKRSTPTPSTPSDASAAATRKGAAASAAICCRTASGSAPATCSGALPRIWR